MNERRAMLIIWRLLAAVWLSGAAQSARACAACFGQSDSDLARGMNMGIFALLGVVVCVLAGIALFFVFLARRAAVTASGTKVAEPARSEL